MLDQLEGLFEEIARTESCKLLEVQEAASGTLRGTLLCLLYLVISPFQIEIMAGQEADAQFQFTGIKKYFNSYTLTGRMNCVLATYGGIALLVLYFKLRSKKTSAVKAT